MPMRKQGGIILGTGEQSNGYHGNFYGGYMATGATTDDADDVVKANIVAAGYNIEVVTVDGT